MDKIRASLKESLYRKLTLGYSLARTATFATQGVFLPWVDLIATGRKREVPKNYSDHLQQAFPKIQKLLENDVNNIHNNFYPMLVLWPENPFTHGLRLPKLVIDSIQASKRREQKNNDFFETSAKEFLEELPDYSKRNFHFQTSGYLGEQSADLYEHQVEILFSGAADAMRRLIIPQVKLHLRSLGLDESGSGLHFLELGSGTGRLTRFMALAFPKANITSLDLSSVYLSKAKERLSQFKRINFIQGAAGFRAIPSRFS